MDIEQRVEKLADDVTELKVSVAVNTTKLNGLVDKVDEVGTGVKEISKSLVGEKTASLNRWKSIATKVAFTVGGSSGLIALLLRVAS